MDHPDPMAVTQYEVLRSAECESVRDQVLALREYWTSRSSHGGFFTLGVASYLDAVGRRDAYLEAARELNPILHANFDWLCARLRKGFENLFERPVSFSHGALPGFHVFQYYGTDQTSDRPYTRAHFDMQWAHAIPGQRPEKTLSFTLPIEEPTGGSSLEVWPVHCDAVPSNFDALKYAATFPSKTLRYSRGQMVVHDGLILHAIGRPSTRAPEGYRITLQGHGALEAGEWKLYW